MPDPEFYIGRKGAITNEEYQDWTVEVVDDSAGETGGYFILYFDKDGSGGDDWLEKKEHVPLYFANNDWVIEWQ